jgi:hypothetical protein
MTHINYDFSVSPQRVGIEVFRKESFLIARLNSPINGKKERRISKLDYTLLRKEGKNIAQGKIFEKKLIN